jgi:hypothetical protein
MKYAAIALVIMSSLAASATSNPPGCDLGTSKAKTCTANLYGLVSVAAFIPCINNGKGENVAFSNPQTTIFHYTVTNGARNGFLMFVGGGLTGKGQTTGIQYNARGSEQLDFADWVPFNPDGSANGDGEFTYNDNYYIYSTSPVVNVIWHRTQHFTLTNNSMNLSLQPDEVVCR